MKTKAREGLNGYVRITVNASGTVRKMIDEMIAILTKDNKDDLMQKDFCISELTKTEKEKAATEDKLSSLAASIEEMTDASAEMSDKIKALQEGTRM